MTRDQFDALVDRLDGEARLHPRLYRAKLLLLAAAGNTYIFAALSGLAGLLAAAAFFLQGYGVKILLLGVFFIWRVLKALRVKSEPPEGVEVKPAEAPLLFAMIAELRGRLAAPRFHRVLVTTDHNAGVMQVPRLGLFGWHRNYLLIGLPMLKTLTVEQLRAVLAHEFGHLARGHGAFGNRIYCQRRRWTQLLENLEHQPSHGDFLFKPFFNWFTTYFSAYSFPLARANEYEADAASVRLTSREAVAEALTGTSVIGAYLEERYWPRIHGQAADLPVPDATPFLNLGEHLAAEIDDSAARDWLARATCDKTTSRNTHPSLADRLRAIDAAPQLAPPATGAAADTLLGPLAVEIARRFDRHWHDAILPDWRSRHEKVQQERRELADLEARLAAGEELNPQEAYDRALLTESIQSDAESAFEQLRRLYVRDPDEPVLCLALGLRMLNRDDDNGIPIIKGALKNQDHLAMQVCEAMRAYNWRHGRKTEADGWHQHLLDIARPLQAAARERSEVHLADRFAPHELSEEQLAAFQAQLAALPALRRAYLVRKELRHFPERPCYVFGYSTAAWWQWPSKVRGDAAMQAMQQQVVFPAETLIISIEGNNLRFAHKLRRVAGARVL